MSSPTPPPDDKNAADPATPGEAALSRMGAIFNRLRKDVTAADPAGSEDFFRAAKRGDAALVEKMLAAGTDPNLHNGAGETALHICARNGQAKVALLLIEHGADPARGTRDDAAALPIEDAVRFGHSEVAEVLVRHGGYDPEAQQQKEDSSPLLHRSCEKGKEAIVAAMMRAGADGNARAGNGATPLLAALLSRQAKVASVLLDFADVVAGMNTHTIDSDAQARNAFQMAVSRGEAEVVAKMAKLGVYLNQPDAEGLTPLATAVTRGDLAMVRALIAAGADVHGRETRPELNSRETRPETNSRDARQVSPLMRLATTKSMAEDTRAAIAQALVDAGADPEARDPASGESVAGALMQSRNINKTLGVLIRARIDVNARNGAGMPLLMAALAHASVHEVANLLSAGADPDAREMQGGETPLMLAAREGKADCLGELLAAGANARLLDAQGRSARHHALHARVKSEAVLPAIDAALRRETKPLIRRQPEGGA